MRFEYDNLYHIYNQGNNKQQIFFSEANYLYYLKLYRNFVHPFTDTIAYCLMPNHFHFLIHTNEQSINKIKIGSLYLSQLSNGIRKLLSSYAAAINKQKHTTGSLFRQKTKAELINNASPDYAVTVFNYIHQNPLNAKLVKHLTDWNYSSYKDYAGLRNGSLCNKLIAKKLIDINWNDFESGILVAYNNKNYNNES